MNEDMTTKFKNIQGFDGYRIGDDGSVWSKRKIKEKWQRLKPWPNQKGYLQVNLYRNEQGHTRKVHRLVLEAFVGLCPPDMECRHLDGNKINNQLENLQWGTSKENKDDMNKHDMTCKGKRNGQAKLTEEGVVAIRETYRCGNISHRQLAKLYGVSKSAITSLLRKESWKHLS